MSTHRRRFFGDRSGYNRRIIMKVVLARITGDSSDAAVLDAALAVARPFQGHIEALYMTPDPRSSIPFLGEAVSASLIEELYAKAERESAAAKERARSHFEAWRKEWDVALREYPDHQSRASAAWDECIGDDYAIVSQAGRIADLVVVARPGTKDDIRTVAATEAAIFNTGRLALLIPPATRIDSSARTAIAWNGSREAARALGAAVPLLQSATAVSIISVAEADKGGAGAEAARDYLGWHGVKATVTRCEPQGSVAQTIFARAHEASASMLVMGAYTHTRLRELVFGGVTDHVLARTNIPTLMCH
jgi:nucleotide-binding universal stress UspA family protein